MFRNAHYLTRDQARAESRRIRHDGDSSDERREYGRALKRSARYGDARETQAITDADGSES